MCKRCEWCLGEEIYIKYHDEEWGVPTFDDRRIFEFIILESAQAGLSWLTILKKRENYRKAFYGFEPSIVANFDEEDISTLMENSGIIRNRKKIEAAIGNAKTFIKIQEEFGSFSNYMWGYVNGKPIINTWESIKEVPATTELSDRMSADLKKRGFKFFGSVICYSHLQALGVINDHITSCFRYNNVFELGYHK